MMSSRQGIRIRIPRWSLGKVWRRIRGGTGPDVEPEEPSRLEREELPEPGIETPQEPGHVPGPESGERVDERPSFFDDERRPQRLKRAILHDEVWRRRRRKVLLIAVGVLVLAGLTAAHIDYWYLPRLRPASPRPGLLPARLLDSDAFPFAAWMPYPHQNLAVLEEATAPDRATSDLPAALARLAGVPEPSLPAFGSFRVPPSREIAFAADEHGERFVLVAEVYPVVAAFAKLAGRLADNRWLRGGELTVEGRRVEVAWNGRVWTVASPRLPNLGGGRTEPRSAAPAPKSLFSAEVREANPPFPGGRFHLRRDGRDLVLTSQAAPPAELAGAAPDITGMGLFLLVISGGDAELAEPKQAMAFFSRENPLRFSKQGVRFEFPGTAAIYETGSKRWELPGEGLLEWTGKKPRQTEIGNFSVAALDRRSFRRVQRLAPRFAELVRRRPDGRLLWGLWFDLEAGREEVSRIARAMEEIPIVSNRHRRRWRDAATVLAPAARYYSRLSVVVSEEPRALELRFLGRDVASD